MNIEELNHPVLIRQWLSEIKTELNPIHQEIDNIVEINQGKLLKAYQREKISSHHLQGSDGYGYDDEGREALGRVYAHALGSEAAIVRPQFVSGTHAITAALFGNLRPGDEIIYASGNPYDTMKEVLGLVGHSPGNFREYHIHTRILPLTAEGKVNLEKLWEMVNSKTKWIVLQRSCGYDERPSIPIRELKRQIDYIKNHWPHIYVFIDNCYGEFVEEKEPGNVGADLLAGSLIKNPGGGLAKTGGYIAGNKELVEAAASRLSAPGIGMDAGATGGFLDNAFQGFFLAPMVVGEAVKGAQFTAALLQKAGFQTNPKPFTPRTDLIQSVTFQDRDQMIAFCQSIQKHSPVNAHAVPIPGPLPGYEGDVIMAAGTFVQGASIELSADGPVKPPYIAYIQGGLSFVHVKLAVTYALDEMLSI
ncbi:cystathionine beta-lyase family protein involved in aluminum resistance [Geomicrobium halophilum]|uniref:Cystathionine beta-lyase family protein involved in aluminum resistance n=1 Tax=Geomicrobium halophilum TaxID=549000 RepID=A0A841PN89_9BACL|nr:aminotransferase class I/II-fold pyridoxal phosphate-dependent enzyme [Geomicrobium halophilum]MBB6449224.1 cystathionine beta-lyase family protein involved in aluminum resistance [Geomicrobium halophilum]